MGIVGCNFDVDCETLTEPSKSACNYVQKEDLHGQVITLQDLCKNKIYYIYIYIRVYTIHC